MHRLNLVSVLFILAAVFSLSACQSSRSYRSGQAEPAIQAPSDLSATPLGPPTPAGQAQTTAQQPVDANLPPVKVALLLPLSGQNAALGQAMMKASQIALFDVDLSNFELMPKDTGGTPEGAAQAAREALKEGAKLILGPVFANEVRAVKPVAAGANVNVIAFSTDWTLAGGNTFIMGFLPFDQIERVTRFAALNKIGRVGVVAPQNDYGRAVTRTFNSASKSVGIAAVDTMPLPTSNTAIDAAVKKFSKHELRQLPQNAGKPAPFDAVLMPVGGETARAVSTSLSLYGLPPQSVRRLGTGLFDDPALAVHQGLSGAWFAAPSPRLRENFERRYMSTYSQPAPRLATLAYDATALASVLAKRGLSTQGQPFFDRASITNSNGFAGIDGIFRFRPNGTAERGLAVLEYDRGAIRIVDEAPRTFQAPPSQ